MGIIEGLLYIAGFYYGIAIIDYICLRLFCSQSREEANIIISNKYFGGN